MPRYKVTAYHGTNNRIFSEEFVTAQTAKQAAEIFIERTMPGETLYAPGRWEQPRGDDYGVYSIYSFGWSGSGQRIWVMEL